MFRAGGLRRRRRGLELFAAAVRPSIGRIRERDDRSQFSITHRHIVIQKIPDNLR